MDIGWLRLSSIALGENPDLQPGTTTNSAESFHGHLNDDFNTPHQNKQALLRHQTATYISIVSNGDNIRRGPEQPVGWAFC